MELLKPITDRFLKHNSEVIADCQRLGISFRDYTTDEICLGHNMRKLGRVFSKGRVSYDTTYCPDCDLEIADYKANERSSREAFLNKCTLKKREGSTELRAKKKELHIYKEE